MATIPKSINALFMYVQSCTTMSFTSSVFKSFGYSILISTNERENRKILLF